jgi:hypothetical protein
MMHLIVLTKSKTKIPKTKNNEKTIYNSHAAAIVQ